MKRNLTIPLFAVLVPAACHSVLIPNADACLEQDNARESLGRYAEAIADHNPANHSESNPAALCQACHNLYDAPKRAQNRERNALRDAGQLRLELEA